VKAIASATIATSPVILRANVRRSVGLADEAPETEAASATTATTSAILPENAPMALAAAGAAAAEEEEDPGPLGDRLNATSARDLVTSLASVPAAEATSAIGAARADISRAIALNRTRENADNLAPASSAIAAAKPAIWPEIVPRTRL